MPSGVIVMKERAKNKILLYYFHMGVTQSSAFLYQKKEAGPVQDRPPRSLSIEDARRAAG